MKPNIHIVYYAYIMPPRWSIIIGGQCEEIMASDIDASITVVLCSEYPDLLKMAVKLVEEKLSGFKHPIDIRVTDTNDFEYPGISCLHSLASMLPSDTLFIYMHSKGMVFHHLQKRNPTERVLTNDILDWKKYIPLFDDPTIQKAGLLPTHYGAVWYNFYWVRGSYLKKLSPPIKSRCRYYFEHWVGNNQHPPISGDRLIVRDADPPLSRDCYCTYASRKGHVTQCQAWQFMEGIVKNSSGMF